MEKQITYQEWLYLAKQLKKELLIVTAIVAVVIFIIGQVVMSAFSAIVGGSRTYSMTEIENRIDVMAAENGVTIYPFRYNKIMTEIMATQDTTASNVEEVILKNIKELKEITNH